MGSAADDRVGAHIPASEVRVSEPERSIDRRMRHAMEVLVPTVAIAFSFVFFVSVGDLAAQSSLYPRIVSGLVIVLSSVSLLRFFKARQLSVDASAEEEEDFETLNGSWVKAGFCIAVTIVYGFAISRVGFYVSTGLYAFTVAAVLGRPAILRPLVFAASITGVSYLSFGYLMEVPMPSGWLF
jgi:hypothetical protein